MTDDDRTQAAVVYKDIDGFPGYRIGSDGSVWSCRWSWGHGVKIRPDHWRKLRPGLAGAGYRFVNLHGDAGKRTRYIHRLLLEAFVGPCPPGHEGCHNNGDRTDNRLVNLRWATHRENIADREAHGGNPKGTRNGQAKLDEAQVQAIREMRAEGQEYKAISAKFGVSTSAIGFIVKRKLWRHI